MKIEIYEEALASLIKRVDKLESRDSVPQKSVQNTKQTNFNLATPGQITYARNLGGDPWEEITKQEVSEMIDELKPKSNTQKPKVIEVEKQDYIDRTKPLGKSPVETMQSKPLTEEQIEELGEEAFI